MHVCIHIYIFFFIYSLMGLCFKIYLLTILFLATKQIIVCSGKKKAKKLRENSDNNITIYTYSR